MTIDQHNEAAKKALSESRTHVGQGDRLLVNQSIAHSLIVLNARLDGINASIMEVGGDGSNVDKIVGRLDAVELVLREGLGQT